MGSATDLDTRNRYRCPEPAAVTAPDRDLGVLPEVGQSETACIESKNVVAGNAPDHFGRSIEMADTQIAIDDDDGIAGLLERGKQERGGFDRWATGGVHRLTL